MSFSVVLSSSGGGNIGDDLGFQVCGLSLSVVLSSSGGGSSNSRRSSGDGCSCIAASESQ